jgi:hypothetical protein
LVTPIYVKRQLFSDGGKRGIVSFPKQFDFLPLVLVSVQLLVVLVTVGKTMVI